MDEEEDIHKGPIGWIMFFVYLTSRFILLFFGWYVYLLLRPEASFWIVGLLALGMWIAPLPQPQTPAELRKEEQKLNRRGIPETLGAMIALVVSGAIDHADPALIALSVLLLGIAGFFVHVYRLKRVQKKLLRLDT